MALTSIAFGMVGFVAGKSLADERIVEKRVEVPVPVETPAEPPPVDASAVAFDMKSRELAVALADTLDGVADNLSETQIADYDALLSRPPAPLKTEAAIKIREALDGLRRLRDDLRFGSRKALHRLAEQMDGIEQDLARIAEQAARDLDRAGVAAAGTILRKLAQDFRARGKERK
ncbi:MAG: hypothetical protein ACE37K_15540 [Planctomycetota bacterium]